MESTVILADGAFPQHPVPLDILKSADRIICCDGATQKLLDWGRNPDIIVGDLDSLSDELKERFADIIFPSPDQETNDLTKAVDWCIANNINDVTIIGATGMREDHTLGNISLLAEYVERINVKMMTDYGIFTSILKSGEFKGSIGQQISIFAITPATKITTTGLKYNVYNRQFTNWWQGTLNEVVTEDFSINFDYGKLILFSVYTN